jgi:CRP/FNR family transcriptional regulator
LAGVCLPVAVRTEGVARLDSLIQRGKPIRKGEHLFRAGDAFRSVYVVRSGAVKTYSVSVEGEEQVTGFYLPGEVLGVDGISAGSHTNFAIALETTAVCEITYDTLSASSLNMPGLQQHFFKVMSQAIQSDQQLMRLLSKNNAEERIGAFLLNLSARYERRGLSPYRFRLSMSRNEIGNYLGLAVETVSRVLTRLQKQVILAVDGREIEIRNMQKLYAVTHGLVEATARRA